MILLFFLPRQPRDKHRESTQKHEVFFLQVSFFGEDPKKFKAQDVLKIISSTCDDYTKAYAMTPYSTSSALRCAVLLCAALRCCSQCTRSCPSCGPTHVGDSDTLL